MTESERAALVDKILLLFVKGVTVDVATTFSIKEGCNPEQAASLVSEARKKLTVAADFARDEQFGLAAKRLNDLYSQAMGARDLKTALQAQREINRMLDLYAGKQNQENGGAADEVQELRAQLERIAEHIVPLGLAPEQHPIEEHVRLAAGVIRSNGLSNAIRSA